MKKTCIKCNRELDINSFGFYRKNPPGRRNQCKECCNKYVASWAKLHPEINGYARTKRNREIWSKRYNVSISAIAHHGLKIARFVFDKYNRKCNRCGSKERLAIHHIDGKGRNYTEKHLRPNNNTDNLELLCIRCHGSIHGKVGGILSGIARRKTSTQG